MDNTLELLHKTLLVILDEIDRICRANGISYFLDSGTALGAVRHGGFIPWDDDADIGMIRSDYEKFLKVAPKQLSDKFFLQTRETDPGFIKRSAKIRLNGTFYPEKRNEGTSLHQGIFVDIFPFDFVNDDSKIAEREIKKSRCLSKIFALQTRCPLHESFFRKIARKVARIIPTNKVENALHDHYTKYMNKETSTLTSYSYKMSDHLILLFSVSDMFPTRDIKFEDRTYMIMNNADKYLSTMYGDYMQLPPDNQRIWHYNGGIKFE